MLSFDSKFDVCVLGEIVARFCDFAKMGVDVSGKPWHGLGSCCSIVLCMSLIVTRFFLD